MDKSVMSGDDWYVIRKELAEAYGKPVDWGFLVRAGSTAMRDGSPRVKRYRVVRDGLVAGGVLIPDENPALFQFSVDYVFSSPSTAAGVVIDGNSNGSHWSKSGSGSGWSELQALLDRLERTHIEQTIHECDAIGLSSFLERGGFVRPDVWVHGYPAKCVVASALVHLPGGRFYSARDFFGGFGEQQAFKTLQRLGYDLTRPEKDEEQVTDIDATSEILRPTNLILYGPPGTGKTYHTACPSSNDLERAA